MRRDVIARELERALRNSLGAPELCLHELGGERPAEDETREPWIVVKYGPATPDDWFGVVRACARFTRDSGGSMETLPLAVKVNPRDGASRTLIPWIIDQQKIPLDRPYWEYRSASEFDHTGDRECHVYRLQQETALTRVLPKSYGQGRDDETGEHVLFLELIDDASLLDATGASAEWSAEAIDEMLEAAAGWHAAFWGREAELTWSGPRMTTADRIADVPLWRGLLADARSRFPQIVTDAIWRRRSALIDGLAQWHAVKDGLPTTLAHNDFNQRNVGFCRGPLVLDWEIVQRNTAQRDLVELLTFALPAAFERSQVERHLEHHRRALAAHGVVVGARDWLEGFRCELKLQAIDRIALQFVFAAGFPLAYIERINLTIERLIDVYG